MTELFLNPLNSHLLALTSGQQRRVAEGTLACSSEPEPTFRGSPPLQLACRPLCVFGPHTQEWNHPTSDSPTGPTLPSKALCLFWVCLLLPVAETKLQLASAREEMF